MQKLISDILAHEGAVSIVTSGQEGPHLVGTWNSYIEVDGNTLIIPAGFYHKTEENLKAGSSVQILIGTKEVQGKMGPGAGVLLTGNAKIHYEDEILNKVKARFPWARGVLLFTYEKAEQLI